MLDLLINLTADALEAAAELAVLIRDLATDRAPPPSPAMPTRPRLFRRERRRWTLHKVTIRCGDTHRRAG